MRCQQHSSSSNGKVKSSPPHVHASEKEEVTECAEDDQRQQPVQRVNGDDHKVNVKWPAPHVPQVQNIQSERSVRELPATRRTPMSLKPCNDIYFKT